MNLVNHESALALQAEGKLEKAKLFTYLLDIVSNEGLVVEQFQWLSDEKRSVTKSFFFQMTVTGRLSQVENMLSRYRSGSYAVYLDSMVLSKIAQEHVRLVAVVGVLNRSITPKNRLLRSSDALAFEWVGYMDNKALLRLPNGDTPLLGVGSIIPGSHAKIIHLERECMSIEVNGHVVKLFYIKK